MRSGVRPEEYFAQLRRLGQSYALMTVGFIVFVVVFGQALLGHVFEESFRAAYPVLVIFALAVLALASFFLSARYGAPGAAAAMVLACAVSGLDSSFVLPATRGISWAQLSSYLPRLR